MCGISKLAKATLVGLWLLLFSFTTVQGQEYEDYGYDEYYDQEEGVYWYSRSDPYVPCPYGNTDWKTWLDDIPNPGKYFALICYYGDTAGPLPTTISRFSNLQYIQLEEQQALAGPLPTEIGTLVNLKWLEFTSNQVLDGPLPTELGNLENLKVLHVENNQFTGNPPTELGLLSNNLLTLTLSGNQMDSNVPAEFANLLNLQGINLSNGKFKGTLPVGLFSSNIFTYPNSRWEAEWDTQFWKGDDPSWEYPGEISSSIWRLPILQISLSQNAFSGPLPTELGYMTNVRELYVQDNQFSGPIPTEIGKLVNLARLELAENKLSGLLPIQLRKLSKVYRVDISDNDISGIVAPDILRGWAEAREFEYDGNPNLITSPCEQDGCPYNSTCTLGEEIRFGFFEFQCKCEPGFVNEANPDTQDVPIGGTCEETILLEFTDASSTSLRVRSQRPGEGDAVQFNLEKFVSDTRRELLSVYTNVKVDYLDNYASFTFDSLDPGSKYHVGATILQDGKPHEELNKKNNGASAETHCNCVDDPDGDTTGRPRDVVVRQSSGYITFDFVDNSRCEEAFSFSRRLVHPDTRRPAGGESVFTPNYYYFGKSACDEQLNPGLQAADDLRESHLPVGSTFSYDIRAVSKDYSFASRSSNPATVYHQILWEASVDGSVTLSREAGLLPVENVLVEYQLRTKRGADGEVISTCGSSVNFDGWCTTTTGEGGGFQILLRSNHTALNNEFDFPLILRFSKTTGDIDHTFLCDEGVDDCSAPDFTVVFLKHLQLNKPVHVVDDTTVPFVGKVTVKGTKMDGAGALGCPIANAEVCLEDHTGRNNLETQATCVQTDSDGIYRLPAVLGTRVSPAVYFYEHDFAPVSPDHVALFDRGIKIEPGKTYEGYNFQDITKADLVVEVAGGLCNRPLGKSTVHLTMPGCAWEGQDLILQETQYKQTFPVVAQLVTLELTDVVGGDGVDRFNIVDSLRNRAENVHTIDLVELENEDIAMNQTDNTPEGAAPGQAVAGLPDDESSEGAVLRQEEEKEADRMDLKLVRFQYDGQDDLRIQVGDPLNATCFEDVEDGTTFHTTPTSKPVPVSIFAQQEFGYGIRACDSYPENTTLTIRNFIGEADDEDVDYVNSLSNRSDFEQVVRALRRCKPTCKESLVHDSDGSNARVELELFAGRPNSKADLTKSLIVTMDRSAVTRHAKVVVTGDVEIADKLTVAVPTHKPLLVLRDPPGGHSYSFYENVLTTIRVDMKDFEVYAGFDVGLAAAFGADIDTHICAGLGVMACKDALETEIDAGVNVDGGADLNVLYDETTSGAEFTTTWSYSTSQDVWLAGKQSDTFLVPNLNVKFKEVDTVFLDDVGCPDLRNELKFALDSPDNKPAIAFVSRFDVESVELADLERLRAQEEAKVKAGNLTGEDLEEAILSEQAFANALSDWRSFLQRHDDVAAMAANETLEGLKPGEWFELFREDAIQKDKDANQKRVDNFLDDPVSNAYGLLFGRSENLDKLPEKHWSGMVPLSLAERAKRTRNVGSASNENGEDESVVLNRINQIKFDGGGSSLRFELSQHKYKEHTKRLGPPQDNLSVHASGGFTHNADVDVFGVKAAITVNGRIHGNSDMHHRGQDTTGETTKIGFVLGDDDSGDVFDIDVYLDPDYGTFVFHTVGGRSRCPVEANTDAREVPIVRYKSFPSGPVMPDEPLLFEVELINGGLDPSSFQLFTDHRANPGLLAHVTNGDTLTVPQQYDRILPDETVVTTIMIERGQVGYDFEAFPLIFRSACEGTRNIGDGNLVALLPDGVAAMTLNLSNVVDAELGERIRFAEPCPSIEWAGDLAREESFLVNVESDAESPDTLRVAIRNLEASQRSLQENVADPLGRLSRVELRYRRVGSGVWSRAMYKDTTGGGGDGNVFGGSVEKKLIDFAQLEEDEFGYISVDWTLEGLGDGVYELEARSICDPNPGSPTDFNQFQTKRLDGVIDRSAPVPFGSPQPITGKLLPGQAVSFEFNEDMLCGDVAVFEIRVDVDGLERKFDNVETNNLLTVCQGRIISFQFESAEFLELAGKMLNITLSNVQDKHGNVAIQSVTHSIEFSGVNDEVAPASMELRVRSRHCSKKRKVRKKYQFTPEQIEELQQQVAVDVEDGVDPSRIVVESARCGSLGIAIVQISVSPSGSGRRLDNRGEASVSPIELYHILRDIMKNEESIIVDILMKPSVSDKSDSLENSEAFPTLQTEPPPTDSNPASSSQDEMLRTISDLLAELSEMKQSQSSDLLAGELSEKETSLTIVLLTMVALLLANLFVSLVQQCGQSKLKSTSETTLMYQEHEMKYT